MRSPDGGLDQDSVALGEQVRTLAKTRFLRLRGILSFSSLAQLDKALLIALDMQGQVEFE